MVSYTCAIPRHHNFLEIARILCATLILILFGSIVFWSNLFHFLKAWLAKEQGSNMLFIPLTLNVVKRRPKIMPIMDNKCGYPYLGNLPENTILETCLVIRVIGSTHCNMSLHPVEVSKHVSYADNSTCSFIPHLYKTIVFVFV